MEKEENDYSYIVLSMVVEVYVGLACVAAGLLVNLAA